MLSIVTFVLPIAGLLLAVTGGSAADRLAVHATPAGSLNLTPISLTICFGSRGTSFWRRAVHEKIERVQHERSDQSRLTLRLDDGIEYAAATLQRDAHFVHRVAM